MIAICTRGIVGRARGGDGSVVLNVALLVPFVALIVFAVLPGGPDRRQGPASPCGPAWRSSDRDVELHGWDNLSTIAGEVEAPQRNYSRAMLGCGDSGGRELPSAGRGSARITSIRTSGTTGGWVDVGRAWVGKRLAVAMAAAGVIGAFGSFGALMLSFTRLPAVMAEDGYLPKMFTRKSRARARRGWRFWFARVFWAVCSPLGFERASYSTCC